MWRGRPRPRFPRHTPNCLQLPKSKPPARYRPRTMRIWSPRPPPAILFEIATRSRDRVRRSHSSLCTCS